MSSRLLPRHTQVATLEVSTHALRCSNLEAVGSRWVAGWVAAWYLLIRLIYALFDVGGSRCSSFIQSSTLEERRGGEREKYTYKYLNRDKLLHLLPLRAWTCDA